MDPEMERRRPLSRPDAEPADGDSGREICGRLGATRGEDAVTRRHSPPPPTPPPVIVLP